MREIEVVYEKGVFKPLENVKLKEGVKGKVRIEEEEEGFEDFERFFGIFIFCLLFKRRSESEGNL